MMFNSYIGACLHNIGIVYLLLNKPKEAFTHFERATAKRSATVGVGHTDYIASHVKQAICQIALGKQTEAVVILEECLTKSKKGARSISDQRQVAEICNNLGCLYYAFGNNEKAGSCFLESFQAQQIALEHSLYAGARFSCHSASLNLAVTKANMGFLALVARHHEVAIDALEYAVHNQSLLLRDAHRTLIATMDHLVVAQIFAGNKDKAIQLLRRMHHMQSDAFGPSDSRSVATNKKLVMLEEAESTQSLDEDLMGSNSSVVTGTDSGEGASLSAAISSIEKKQRPNILKIFKSMTRK
jgi:tetratricopeptide (TPR) repeat protein